MRHHFLYSILATLFAIYSAQELYENCTDVSGQRHKVGDSYIGVDGCNSCKCLVSQGVAASACTKKLCPKNDAETPIGRDTAYKCVDVKGNPHSPGENYTHVDGCNTCTCLEAGGACTRKYCLGKDKDLGCRDLKGNIMTGLNKTYIGRDECNQCICGVLGEICTEMLCENITHHTDHENEAEVDEIAKNPRGNIGNKNCIDAKNITKNAGEKWLTEDSCNICWCTGDGVGPVCTKMSCSERYATFARLVGNGASINVVSIISVLAVTLIIVTL